MKPKLNEAEKISLLQRVTDLKKAVKTLKPEKALAAVTAEHERMKRIFEANQIDKVYVNGLQLAYDNSNKNHKIRFNEVKQSGKQVEADVSGYDDEYIKEPLNSYTLHLESTILQNAEQTIKY